MVCLYLWPIHITSDSFYLGLGCGGSFFSMRSCFGLGEGFRPAEEILWFENLSIETCRSFAQARLSLAVFHSVPELLHMRKSSSLLGDSKPRIAELVRESGFYWVWNTCLLRARLILRPWAGLPQLTSLECSLKTNFLYLFVCFHF